MARKSPPYADLLLAVRLAVDAAHGVVLATDAMERAALGRLAPGDLAKEVKRLRRLEERNLKHLQALMAMQQEGRDTSASPVAFQMPGES